MRTRILSKYIFQNLYFFSSQSLQKQIPFHFFRNLNIQFRLWRNLTTLRVFSLLPPL